jgi:hypothetical protein
LKLDRAKVREDAFRFSWARTAELFLHNIINACGYAEVARSPRNVVRSAARPSTSRFTPKTT